MSFTNSAFRILRQSVVGMEGMFVKMFDPPTESPVTPDKMNPTNPVPEVMAAAGLQNPATTPHTVMRDLMHGDKIRTWDNVKDIVYFLIRDGDNPTAQGTFPGPTIRLPRGVIFHGDTKGHGPPPHTIHWHGLEPTPQNDGVGHCSMEIGDYTYQFQPNFIGTYFYHCHRNTVQHFEFGLYGLFLVEPPDVYFASIASVNPDGTVTLNNIPLGCCRDGKRRTAANLIDFPHFPGFNSSPIADPDPQGQFPTDPHAMTVPYDVEALWVFDDRDSIWSDKAPSPFATFPKHGDIPGVNDGFQENAGVDGFFAFNDFNADYWFVTGVPVPAHKGGTGAIPAGIVIPPALNSGVFGSQVSINAQVGQTILVRCLDGAYNCIEITFPVDVVIIAWDGRALGVPPYGQYNHAYLVPANTPIHTSVARRFEALIRATSPINDFATVKFIDTRGQVPGTPENVLVTAQIPINITGVITNSISGTVRLNTGAPLAGVAMALSGAITASTITDVSGNYSFPELGNGNYTITPSLAGFSFAPANRNVNINNVDIINQNFVGTAIPVGFAVSGTVTNQSGAPMAGVTLSLSGAASATAVTDTGGNYTFSGLANGNYNLTPSFTGFIFAPVSRNVAVNGANIAGQNFTASPVTAGVSVSGIVTTLRGRLPVAGVTMTLTGPLNLITVTDTAGSYSFNDLPDGTYTVTPSLAGARFSPSRRTLAVRSVNLTSRNFFII